MFVIVFKYLTPKWVRGISIFPFIILSYKHDKKNKVLIHHEKIHIRQQLEMLVLLFYACYFVEFLVRFLQYKNWDLAYQNISFEREAYANESNLNYLSKRKFWSFINYLKY